MSKSIKYWQEVIYECAVAHGFWKDEYNLPTKIALMHSELSEALESIRHNIPEGEKGCLSEEFADCIIRILDTAEFLGLDMEKAIEKKHAINLKRPYKHNKKF